MIGIVTIHRATNYGAVLQAYALKSVLFNMGRDVSIVDYRNSSIEEIYVNPLAKQFSVKTKVKNLLTWDVQKERNKLFAKFVSTKLQCNEETSVYSSMDLNKFNDIYDAIIAGSDQIWNPFCTGNDDFYYLDFVEKKKRYSYAASLGGVSNKFLQSDCIDKIKRFNTISVREDVAKEKLSEVIDAEIRVDLDPTFLLTKKQWQDISIKQSIATKYVLVYSLSMPDSIVSLAEKYARDNGLEVYYVTLNNLFSKYSRRKNILTCSPEEFLGLIDGAEAVFTNSFHGLAFSIIFEKKFFVEKNQNPHHDNSRLVNVLNKFNLQDRLINCNSENFDGEINYEEVKMIIKAYRDSSMQYLSEI